MSIEDVFPDFHPGSAIRGLRYREELTQAQRAGKIGVKRHHISEIEHGKRPIGKEMAKRLASVLKTDYKVFL
ncbi:MAG: helix-turn-helix transcriptional regulator [bacterium]|nr:helix-turn-helix transcriptional regulator [bacterium]